MGISTGQQQGGTAQQNQSGPGGVKNPGYNNGVMGTKPDKQDFTTQNPLDKNVNEPHKCGLRNADGVGFRITGDNDGESEYGEFPWMVAILKEEKALDQVINVYQCGGSLIHPSVVLTAAHCVQNKKTEEMKVRLGEWDTQTKNELYDYQDRNVVEIVSHAEFYKGGLFNDVALLFLEKPADLMDTVNTICLPPANHNFDLSRCFASGWGKDVFGKQGTYQVILKKIELPIMPYDQCQTALRTTRLGKRFKLHKSFICAGGEKGRDTCKGDGGSPLVCPIPGTINHYYQAGMVAWGIGCGEDGIPGVYVNVPMFRGWIDEHLRQRNITDSFYLYS
uniref:Peptidase S1 domain-containing protein n=1 Tax=Anopheles culicifacies TaxID=139723 RepID=A0A2C9GUK4_9DIPT